MNKTIESMLNSRGVLERCISNELIIVHMFLILSVLCLGFP